MAKRLQIRRDTEANWASVNPTLLQGEIGYVLDGAGNVIGQKVGNGVTSWRDLPFFAASDNSITEAKLSAEVREKLNEPEIKNAEVSVSNTTGAPSATAEVVGDTLKLQFNGIKGERGETANMRIEGYVDTVAQLPTGMAIGTAYGVKDSTYTEANPKYRVYVYTSNGWVDNGLFGGISAGVVQETGDGENVVMSQKAVSEELGEVESNFNRHIIIENVPAYYPFTIGGYIKAGTTIVNNGVGIILANSPSYDGRVDVVKGEQVLITEDKYYFQTSVSEGEVNFNLFSYLPYKDSVNKRYYRSSVNAYNNLPIIIRKGTTIVNHGVGIIIASDSSLADRFDLKTGESFYADTDKSVVRTLTSGDVDIESVSLPTKSIHNRHIADKTISADKTDFISPLNIVGEVTYGKFYNGTTMGDNSLYDVTWYIPVKENQQYCWNVAARFVVLLDSQMNVLRVVEGGFNVITEAGEVYMRVTFYASTDKLYQIEKGGRLSPYTPTSQYFIDKDLLPPSEVKTKSFKAFRQVAELGNNESLVLPEVNIAKNMTMTALLRGAIESVVVGVGLNGYYGLNLTITASEIIVKGGSNNNVIQTISHGLILNDFAVLEIAKGNDSEARIRITNDTGDLFETAITWGTSIGQPFLKNESSSAINATFSFLPKDIYQPVWMFGDSYFGMYDASRWLYYVIQRWKYNKFLVNAKGGESASGALADLKNLLSLGAAPKYVVWCMGMNSGDDTSNGEVNSIWLSVTNNVISICKQFEIELVLATIPSIPNSPHIALNEWVRNSGYRYIDFAASVENGSDYYWKGWGTEDALLSSDKVHPSEKGAAVLAAQAMVDFPEITIVV